MELTVITGKSGKIIGTYRSVNGSEPEAGVGGPIAGAHQKVHVIDLPEELENVDNTDEFHQQLKSHLSWKKK